MSYKVLIAENELAEREVIAAAIRRQFGGLCALLEAGTGQEALALAGREHPDIAILKIELSDMDGIDAARQLRERKEPCAILFLTVGSRASHTRRVLSVRAWDYLVKPLDMEELLTSLASAMPLCDQLSKFASLREAFCRPRPITAGPSRERTPLFYFREQVKAFLLEHYSEDLSLHEAAQALNYSDAYFSKLFKACFQTSFTEFLNACRVERAKTLLLESNLGIQAISQACGYASANYFSRVFKRITGATPTDYRLRFYADQP